MEKQAQNFGIQKHVVGTDRQHTATTSRLLLDTVPIFRIEVAALSDIGQIRKNNEDCFGYDLAENIFVVCDGMGGMAAGEIASNTAVELTMRTYKERSSDAMPPEERLRLSIEKANETVWHMAQQEKQLRGMGTTLVAACIRRNKLVVGNVGDSRAYLLRRDRCVQITSDHSLANERLRLKDSGLSDQVVDRLKQVITRAVGVGELVEPDFFPMELESGDILLLATDGLTRYADEIMIAAHVHQFDKLEDVCRGLIGIAHEKGAEDNVTCLILRVQ